MANVLATIDRDGVEAAFVAAGFSVPPAYRRIVGERLALDDEAAWPSRVRISGASVDTPLLPLSESVRRSENARWYDGLRNEFEAIKAKEQGYPPDELEWDDATKTAASHYKRIASDLGVVGPRRVIGSTDFVVECASGRFILNLDRGGRSNMACRLKIYYYFKTYFDEPIFLSDLRWLVPGALEYFTYTYKGGRIDEPLKVECSGRSALHGIRASLVLLKLLAEHAS